MWDDIQDPESLGTVELAAAFTNCVSMTSIDLTTDIRYSGNYFSDARASFAGCVSMTTVNLGDYLNTSNTAKTSHMFEGCGNLRIVNGVIDLSGMSNMSVNAKDMFKGCDQLQRVSLKLANNTNLTDIDDTSGKYVYEIFGLSRYQATTVITIESSLSF